MRLGVSGAKLGDGQRTSGFANATRRGGIEARTEAFDLAEFFALVTPNGKRLSDAPPKLARRTGAGGVG